MTKIEQSRNIRKNAMPKNVTNKNDLYSSFIGVLETQAKTIDSLKLRIPIEKVKILNPILGDEFYVFSTRTGEEIKDHNFKKNSYFHESKGCKTFYKIERQIGKSGSVSTYLIILFTSKILGVDYFKGIQASTVLDSYERLMDQEVVFISFEDFMFGECTDTDIKIDLIPRVAATKVIDSIYALAKPKKKAIEACSIYRRKTNLGIQFALRKTSKYVSCPYLKFYEKIRELKYNSEVFYQNNFSNAPLPNELLRIETTIKNKKHFKHFGQHTTTLDSVVNNLDNIALLAFKKAFESHMEFSEKNLTSKNLIPKENKEGYAKLNLKERLIYNSIKKNMELGINFPDACIALVEDCSLTKYDKRNMKRLIEKVFKIMGVPSVKNDKITLSTYKAVIDIINGGFSLN